MQFEDLRKNQGNDNHRQKDQNRFHACFQIVRRPFRSSLHQLRVRHGIWFHFRLLPRQSTRQACRETFESSRLFLTSKEQQPKLTLELHQPITDSRCD